MTIFDDSGTKIGVFAIDLSFAQLVESLAAIPLPADGVVYLADEHGTPFVGSDQSYRSLDALPEGNGSLLVYRTEELRNGWHMAVVVPRNSLVRAFTRLAVPFLALSVVVYLVLFGSLALTVVRLGSRSRQLAAYFSDVLDGNDQLRSLFRTRDEFSNLNRRFNDVLHAFRVTEAERLAQEKVYRDLIERTSIGFFTISRYGETSYVNTFCADMLGYGREELLALPSISTLFVDPADCRKFLWALLQNGELRDHRIKLLRKSGDPIWVAITAVASRADSVASLLQVEGFMVDATRHVVEQVRLKRDASTDPLTGLANRRALETAFRECVDRCPTCSLVFFDIDKFKQLNDQHGHDTGDRILRHVAGIGSDVLRAGDVFARYGGDEFAVLLPDTNADAAGKLALRLQSTIAAAMLPNGVPDMPSLSVGVVERTDSSWSLSDMIIYADQALYRSKAVGGDTVSVHEPATTVET